MDNLLFTQTEKDGLLSGKMGVALCLFHSSRLYANDEYVERAMLQIEHVQSNINRDTPFEYADGLAGIGSAICYLVRNEFIDADTDDILSDFDSLLFQIVYFGKHTNLERNTGLTGIGFYLLNRIENRTDESYILLKLKHVLLLVQDIVFACIGMEGYTYPYSGQKALSVREIRDCRRFLKKMLKAGLCPELTKKALAIVEQSATNEHSQDVFSFIDSCDMPTFYMKQLAESHDSLIVRHLATLQLQEMSLPPWWELF